MPFVAALRMRKANIFSSAGGGFAAFTAASDGNLGHHFREARALPADAEQFWGRLGYGVIQGYGLTEKRRP